MLVYIVECSDKSYYVGVTNNLERRLSEHNSGADLKSYTYKKRPVVLKFWEEFSDPIEAIEAEKRIKGWSRKKKEALFERDWKRISELSRVKNK